MRDYYSVQSLHNLVSWPVTSRLPGYLSPVNETATGSSSNGNHNQDPGCPLFHARLRRLLPALKRCITLRQLTHLHHSSPTHMAEA